MDAPDTDKILLENILLYFSGRKFSQTEAARIVGGEKRLFDLIADGSIHCSKESDAKNGKWRLSADQVLRHCRNRRERTQQVKP